MISDCYITVVVLYSTVVKNPVQTIIIIKTNVQLGGAKSNSDEPTPTQLNRQVQKTYLIL